MVKETTILKYWLMYQNLYVSLQNIKIWKMELKNNMTITASPFSYSQTFKAEPRIKKSIFPWIIIISKHPNFTD